MARRSTAVLFRIYGCGGGDGVSAEVEGEAGHADCGACGLMSVIMFYGSIGFVGFFSCCDLGVVDELMLVSGLASFMIDIFCLAAV